MVMLFGLFNSCVNTDEQVNKTSDYNKQESYQEIKKSRIKFNFNQSFEIKEIKKGTSFSDIHVTGVGFQNSSATIKFEGQNPIEGYLIADIDFNGFEELYILTRSTGSGLHGKLLGITSYKGKNYKVIYIPEFDEKLKLNFEYLIGYKGNDEFFVKDMKLFRKFPIYNKTDLQGMPNGGYRVLEYKLIEFDGAFTLQVDLYNDYK